MTVSICDVLLITDCERFSLETKLKQILQPWGFAYINKLKTCRRLLIKITCLLVERNAQINGMF